MVHISHILHLCLFKNVLKDVLIENDLPISYMNMKFGFFFQTTSRNLNESVSDKNVPCAI